VPKKKIPNVITPFWLDSLGLPASGKDEYFKEHNGFTVRLYPSGVISFLFLYRFNGARKQLALGKYPTTGLALARQNHATALAALGEGRDPGAPTEPAPNIVTVFIAGEDFLKNWSQTYYSARWHKTIRCALEANVFPIIGDHDVTQITRQDILALLKPLATRVPGQARNVSKALSKLFWYIKESMGLIASSPCNDLASVIPELRVAEGKDRALSDFEIKKLWRRIDRFPGSGEIKRALKLVLVLGQRPEEVAEMHRREITREMATEGEEFWWTIPKERIKTERSKLNKKTKNYDHRVYLTPLALSLIGDARGYIFQSPRQTAGEPEKPIRRNSISQRVERPDTVKHGKCALTVKYYGLPVWSPHDLRRTVKTGLAALEIPDRWSDETINHKPSHLEATYNKHSYDRQKKKALMAWSEHLQKVLGLVQQEETQAEPGLADYSI
jgi:integrase